MNTKDGFREQAALLREQAAELDRQAHDLPTRNVYVLIEESGPKHLYHSLSVAREEHHTLGGILYEYEIKRIVT